MPASMADTNPPSLTPGEGTEPESQEVLRRIRSDYGELLARAKNKALANRLRVLEDKYNQVAGMERQAEVDPIAGLERDNLLMQAEQELRQLENEIGEVWWSSLSLSEQQLFDKRSQTEIEEMQGLMRQWDASTYNDVADSILNHALRKGYADPLRYLRSASNFDKSQAVRIPPVGASERGTVRWEIRKTREYRIETPDGEIVTYGFN